MAKPDTPQDLAVPVYLMCPPFTLDNRVTNNVLMDPTESVNHNKAFKQFTDLYNYISSKALVYLLPNEGNFQDQPYVANVGVVLPSAVEPTFIMSNFRSPPRRGEEVVAEKFSV